MPPVSAATGKTYWRSLEDLADTPEFRQWMHREFPAGASELLDGDRRQFLKVMGASLALAGLGLAGCRRWPQEKIVPFAHRPPGYVPGEFEHYATSIELGGQGVGLVVTCVDGRPIKIEGNEKHPGSLGATDSYAQAAVLELYDPDRSRHVMRGGSSAAGGGAARVRSTWLEFEDWARAHFGGLANARGAGLAVLSESTSSPSLAAMRQRLLQRFPRAAWYEYEPINNDNEVAGSTIAFERYHRPVHSLDRAAVILSLDSDFLGTNPSSVRLTREFSAGRRPAQDAAHRPSMSRLYVVEAGHSLTGANADTRICVRCTDVAAVAALLVRRMLPELRPSSSIGLRRYNEITPGLLGIDEGVFEQLVADLVAARGRSVVIAGSRQPPEVHVLAHLINEQLGNVGSTVRYLEAPAPESHAESIGTLVSEMSAGNVMTLLVLGGNPAYDAPANLGFARHLAAVRESIHLSLYDDETSSACTWHLPRAHFLESWGDVRGEDGAYAVVQPMIEPLFGGRSAVELVAMVTGDDVATGQDIVRRTFTEVTSGAFDETLWRTVLHDGLLADADADRRRPGFALPKVRRQGLEALVDELWQRWSASDEGAFELVFGPDATVYDGRFANNGWLQELPDPITKLTWDNAVLIGPAAARRLRVSTGDRVAVSMRDGAAVEAAVMVLPGHHPQSATLALGYGRRFEGSVCAGAGFDFYPLRTTEAMGFAPAATLTRISGRYELATTQDHHAPDATGRRGIEDRLPTLIREASFQEYLEHPDFAKHRVHVPHRLSLWQTELMAGADYRWGMSIDLTACTGCSACVVACQAENNIPVVGKDQVTRGREMHWLRVDRYFKGEPESPQAVAVQPVPCMMCENAPCEQVCPVAATTHDRDGLNMMVYNRCVGTRYCSNNCPYKVRRFNYFDYQTRRPVRDGGVLHVTPDYWGRPQSDVDLLLRMQLNPEVTVRTRGVMEKCTYCLQRIAEAKIRAKNEFVKKPQAEKDAARRVVVPDGSFTTACAQACPAGAIVFGDLADPGSRVSALHADERCYEMLEELHVKPRTRYLAKLRNPASAAAAPTSQREASHG
jgi:molybdopterin-containing oxidoreductase family iron-sulfur binding subunit